MKTLMASALFGLAMLVPASAQSIGGTYRAEGTNFDGSTYSGTAEIVLTSATTCVIRWVTGGSTSQGICMRNDDAFAAGYVLGDVTGLVVYKVNPDGSMQGLWTIAGQDGNGTENLYPN
jgi:hypothetical protein